MGDVEMKDADLDEDIPILGFGVLQFIKTAQSQHGLRHNEFARYRYFVNFCGLTEVRYVKVGEFDAPAFTDLIEYPGADMEQVESHCQIQ